MDARLLHAAAIAAVSLSLGAGYRTTNFLVNAPTAQLAQEIGDAAEQYRRQLAIEWLGHVLPSWQRPCPITARVSPQLGAGGATSFMFERGRPFGWQMNIQGSRERILDSVLPHEVNHTVFATHFGRPLPRWADEGACTTVEHTTEQKKQQHLLIRFLTSVPSRGIAFNRMFGMSEYPADILPLYAQGYSVARFLIGMGGKQKFINYIGDGMRMNHWTGATKKHYGFSNLGQLQLTWQDWVRRGCPDTVPQLETSDVALASTMPGGQSPSAPIYRAQSADEEDDRRKEFTPSSQRSRPSSSVDDMEDTTNPHRRNPTSKRGSGVSWYAQQSAVAKAKRQERSRRVLRTDRREADAVKTYGERTGRSPRTRLDSRLVPSSRDLEKESATGPIQPSFRLRRPVYVDAPPHRQMTVLR